MGDKLKKVGEFMLRHNEFFIGLAVGLAVPVVRAKVQGVQLPIQMEVAASIDTGAEAAA